MTANLLYTGRFLPMSRLELVECVQMQMSIQRFQHVLSVEEMAIALAGRYDADVEKASIVALTHDYAKERSADECKEIIRRERLGNELIEYGNAIWHGPVGAYLVQKELGLHDEEILTAIMRHTIGSPTMSLLDKIIYVADYIEAGRNFPGVEKVRKMAIRNLDEAVVYQIKHTLLFLIKTNAKVYPKAIETYNYWVSNHEEE